MSQFDHLLIPSITMWDMFQLQKFENNIPEGEKIRQRSTRYA
jgi:hypothetical protein